MDDETIRARVDKARREIGPGLERLDQLFDEHLEPPGLERVGRLISELSGETKVEPIEPAVSPASTAVVPATTVGPTNTLDYEEIADQLLADNKVDSSRLVQLMAKNSHATFDKVGDECCGSRQRKRKDKQGHPSESAVKSLVARTNVWLRGWKGGVYSQLQFSTIRFEVVRRNNAPLPTQKL